MLQVGNAAIYLLQLATQSFYSSVDAEPYAYVNRRDHTFSLLQGRHSGYPKLFWF